MNALLQPRHFPPSDEFTLRRLRLPLLWTVMLASSLAVAPAKADTPFGIAVGVATIVGAAATVYAVATSGGSDGGSTTTTTTTETTTTETTTTETTTTTTETTTTSEESRAAPGSGTSTGKWYKLENVGVLKQGNGFAGAFYDKLENRADIKLAPESTKKVGFEIVRKNRFTVTRKPGHNQAVSVPIEISADKLSLSTKDIPGTDGKSSAQIIVAADGKTVYTFSASVSQGKKAIATKEPGAESISLEKDSFTLNKLKKRLAVKLPRGKNKLQIDISVITKGEGRRT